MRGAFVKTAGAFVLCATAALLARPVLASTPVAANSSATVSPATPSPAGDTYAARPSAAPAAIEPQGERLRPGAAARLTWWGIHLYDARLHTTPRFDPAQPLTSRFMLELTYARAFAGEEIAEATRDEIERLGMGTAAQVQRWKAAMREIFPDVRPGQRIAGVNLPGEGVLFHVDGRDAGRVDDPAFARAFFAIWLDERTSEPALRRQLLDGTGRMQRVRR